jgi:hypothetical protein
MQTTAPDNRRNLRVIRRRPPPVLRRQLALDALWIRNLLSPHVQFIKSGKSETVNFNEIHLILSFINMFAKQMMQFYEIAHIPNSPVGHGFILGGN